MTTFRRPTPAMSPPAAPGPGERLSLAGIVDLLADGRVCVAVGGNGKAAISADEIGRLAAELLPAGCLGRLVHPCGHTSVRADSSVRHRAV